MYLTNKRLELDSFLYNQILGDELKKDKLKQLFQNNTFEKQL